MSVRSGSPVNEARMAARPDDAALAVRAGLIGGLVGGVSIWIYEAIVWVGVQRLMPLEGRDPQYRVKHDRDGHERVVNESQLAAPRSEIIR